MTRRLQATLRGRNALINIFEMWVALAAIISGLVFFYQPAAITQNALYQVVGHWPAVTWNIAYFFAGVGIWYGLLRPSPRIEVMGLFILGSSTAISAVAIVAVFGKRGAATFTLYSALAVASWLRATFVMRTAIRLAGESGVRTDC